MLRGLSFVVFAAAVAPEPDVFGGRVGGVSVEMFAFTGKATYTGGATLPEKAEDMADNVAISSPQDAPFLDFIGDGLVPARATVHEWVEDSLNPAVDTVNDGTIAVPLTETVWDVSNGSRFQVGDIITHGDDGQELMQVTGVAGNTLTVVRGFGGSTATNLVTAEPIVIVSAARLEGDDAAAPRQRVRTRKSNYTQIFSETVEISGSEIAVTQAAMRDDEFNYQKARRTTEQLQALERAVIFGRPPAANPEGSATIRRYMRGILPTISTNKYVAGAGGIPAGDLTDAIIRQFMQLQFQATGVMPNFLCVSPFQRYKVTEATQPIRVLSNTDRRMLSVVRELETDFGVIAVIPSRWVPKNCAFGGNSGRVKVLPLAGRSFFFKEAQPAADKRQGQVIGEYTVEIRNEDTFFSWRK